MSSKNKTAQQSKNKATQAPNITTVPQELQMPQLPQLPIVSTMVVSESLPNGQGFPALPINGGTVVENSVSPPAETAATPPKKTRARGEERNRYPVGIVEFCKVYQSSKTIKEASERLKMPVNAVMSRAQYYKRMDTPVNLKSFRRGPSAARVDIAALNAELAKLSDAEVSAAIAAAGVQTA